MNLSIIIPVFNVEKYLNNCIDSILKQKYEDYEIILINDGSSDNSGIICDDYAHNYNNIKVLHISNNGVSSARNLGINNAIGNWIYFVDSDDCLTNDILNVFNEFDISTSDCIQFGFRRLLNDSVIQEKVPDSLMLFNNINEFQKLSRFGTYTLWCYFFKRKLILDNDIKFSENIKYAEDLEFVIKCLFFSNKILSIPNVGYKYFVREGSAMSKSISINQTLDYLSVANNLISLSKDLNNSFLIGRIDYMLKSYFSYSICLTSRRDEEIIIRNFKLFKNNNKNSQIFNKVLNIGWFKVLKLNIHFYLFLLKCKVKIKKYL